MNIPRYARDHFSLILVALIFLAILAVSRNYVFLFIPALSLAVVTFPLHRKMIKKIPAPLSAGILTTLIFAIIIGICVFILVVLASDWEYFVSICQTILTIGADLLNLTGGSDISNQMISEIISLVVTLFPSMALGAAQMVPSVIIDSILFSALLYLSIISGDSIWADLWNIVHETSKENVGLMAKKTPGVILIAALGYFLTCVLTDLFIRPKLTGKRVKIRPMLMFVGFFGGAMAMGLLGFVLGQVLLILGITSYEIFIKDAGKKKAEELIYEETNI